MNALAAIERMIRTPGVRIDVADFLLALVFSVVSAIIVSGLYQIFYENRATGSQIHRSFLLLSPSITALFIAIQFSLLLSLGLVGALTIIRFRTPVKEPEEVAFIMLVIATAIVCATFQYLLLVFLIGLALIVLVVQKYVPRLFRSTRNDGMLLITLSGDAPTETREKILTLLREKLVNGRVQNVSFSGNLTSIHYSFAGLQGKQLDTLQSSIQQVAPVQKMSVFYSRQGVLL